MTSKQQIKQQTSKTTTNPSTNQPIFGSNPPPAESLPLPPPEWLKDDFPDFCKECENVYYTQTKEGVVLQLTYQCDCSQWMLE